jgi:hypothetical protein
MPLTFLCLRHIVYTKGRKIDTREEHHENADRERQHPRQVKMMTARNTVF